MTDEVGAINDDYSSFADEPIKNKAGISKTSLSLAYDYFSE